MHPFSRSAQCRTLRLLGLVGALLSARRAHADIPAIQWRAPEECGTREEFEAGVARIVGKPLSELGSSWSSADLSIALEQGTWRLHLVVLLGTGSSRERNVVAGTCREAVDAAELIVATSLSGADAESVAKGEPAEVRAPAQVLPAATPDTPKPSLLPTPALPTPSERAAPQRLSAALGARIGVDARLLPAATEIAWLTLGLGYDPIRLELLLGGTYPKSHAAGVGTATDSLLSVGLVGCYAARSGQLGAFACGGAELGRFTAVGSDDLPNHRTRSALWSAGLVQGELSWALSARLGLLLGVEGVLSFRELEVALSPSSPVYRTRETDLRPWLGVELGF